MSEGFSLYQTTLSPDPLIPNRLNADRVFGIWLYLFSEIRESAVKDVFIIAGLFVSGLTAMGNPLHLSVAFIIEFVPGHDSAGVLIQIAQNPESTGWNLLHRNVSAPNEDFAIFLI